LIWIPAFAGTSGTRVELRVGWYKALRLVVGFAARQIESHC
jgi:hypothetical protein